MYGCHQFWFHLLSLAVHFCGATVLKVMQNYDAICVPAFLAGAQVRRGVQHLEFCGDHEVVSWLFSMHGLIRKRRVRGIFSLSHNQQGTIMDPGPNHIWIASWLQELGRPETSGQLQQAVPAPVATLEP